MPENTLFSSGSIRITDQQISTKTDTVLIRDISAVQIKTSAGTTLFALLLAGVCVLFAIGAGQKGETGLAVGALLVAALFLGALATGRYVVVTTHSGRQVRVANGMVNEMRAVKNAISTAMLRRDAA